MGNVIATAKVAFGIVQAMIDCLGSWGRFGFQVIGTWLGSRFLNKATPSMFSPSWRLL
jgi:hypothetical protein